MRLILARLRKDQAGFTLVTVVGVMGAVMALSIGAVTAVDGDLRPGAADVERKQAYAAAEAGVNDYLARLVADPDYWRQCVDPANPSLNQAGATPRRWADVPATTSQYSIELLPANGRAACDAADPVASFIDEDTATFRIRSTGRVRADSGSRRSIIATFKRRGFLDFIYFTDLETTDPVWYRREAGNRLTREDPRTPSSLPQRDIVTWGMQECGYFRDGRATKRFTGTAARSSGILRAGGNPNVPGDWQDYRDRSCGEIRFVGDDGNQDVVNGPLHTNDHLLLCGSPKFGRTPSDAIEVSNLPTPTDRGWRQQADCSGTPVVNEPGQSASGRGTLRPGAPTVALPPSNASLRDDALPAYRFRGNTRIVLDGTDMTVTGRRDSGAVLTNARMPLPTDGVIYVANDTGGSCAGYDPLRPYAPQPACGDVWVRGTYGRSVTINAENDIVVEDDVRAGTTGKPLLGLISNNWIRVYHPVTSSCQNDGGPGSLTLDAAVLSLRHSFTVDNYWCGAKLGTLTVNGAIAQKYRGPVGQGGASSGTGYVKNYVYNDELKFRSPPRFLDPVQTTWKLAVQVEQVPPA